MNNKHKNNLYNLAKVFVTVGILVYIFSKLNVNIKDLLDNIIDYKFLVLAFVFPTLITTYISANRWMSFLRMIGVRVSVWELIKINFQSAFLSIILPSSQGMDLLRIYKIEKKHPEKRGVVGSTVLIERIFGLVCLLLIAVVAWLFILSEIFVIPIILLFVILCFVFFIIKNETCFVNICKLLLSFKFCLKISLYLVKLYTGIHKFPFTKKLYLSMLLIFFAQLSNILVVYFLFKSYGYNIDLLYHLCYQPLISVITMIPITIGSLGVREGLFIMFYSVLNIPDAIIISVSLFYYICVTLLPALIGGVIYSVDSLKNKLIK